MSRLELRWKDHPACTDLRLRAWLSDSGSLTRRIVSCARDFRVTVLREEFAYPTRDERMLVGLPTGHHAWVREVVLWADGLPVIFAHSILAPGALRGAWRMARTIGKRPLGAALFADPLIVREALKFSCLPRTHPLHQRTTEATGQPLPQLWARRSRFFRQGKPLLVTEVFLPGIVRIGA